MKFSKIVYIRCVPLSKFVYDFLEIDNLLKQGIEVEYIDTSLLYVKALEIEEFAAFKGIVKIDSHKTLKEYIKKQNISNTVFINLTEYNYKAFRIFLILNKYKCKVAFFARFARPVVNIKSTFRQKLDGLRRKLKDRILTYIAFNLKKIGLFKCYDYIFIGGSESLICFFGSYFYTQDLKKARIINVNANDYDKYLSISNNEVLVNKPYCVFLDEYLPYHPDFIISEKKTLDALSYYEGINRTFDSIEKMHDIKIVIAAHPKALNYKTTNPFNGRPIFFEKTPELVSNSQFVIAHYSTAINFAVLYNKPLVYLISNDFEKILPIGAYLMKLGAQTFNSPLIYFDNPVIEEFETKIDSARYSEYKYKFMTSPESESRLTIDILIDFLNNPSELLN